MISRTKIILASFLLFISILACSSGGGKDLPETESPDLVTEAPLSTEEPTEQPATEEAALEEGGSCPVITDAIMELVNSGTEDLEENLLDEEVNLVSYVVSGDDISAPTFEDVDAGLQAGQNDSKTQQQVWKYFSALIPVDRRDAIAEYLITTDGQGGTLASVSQTDTDPNQWALAVDIADTNNYYDLTYTLVHEYGHLLTLGPDQMPPSLAVFNNPDDNDIYLQEVSACPNYFPGEGCANSDSYINAFYNQFWVNIHEEWNTINLEEDEDALAEKQDAFYSKYQDQFVTDYAPTNPEEDIAESWSFFVIGPKPTGDTIADQKILFFYQYPELVELRASILGNLCSAFPE